MGDQNGNVEFVQSELTQPSILTSSNGRSSQSRRQIGNRWFDFDRQVAVMGIVNRTRDSFFDGGSAFALDRAVSLAEQHAAAGADIVDVGAVPFSPLAQPVSAEEEAERIGSFVQQLTARSDVLISVDTWRASVAKVALHEGAVIINDTSGLYDPEMPAVVTAHAATLVLTHAAAAPGEWSPSPHYADVVREVHEHLAERMRYANAQGIATERLIIDPGPDLNKNTLHTLEICRRFEEFTDLGAPVLAAVSNKDFIGESTDLPKSGRGTVSAVSAALCVERGARLVRTHDPAGIKQTVDYLACLAGWRSPTTLRHNMPEGGADS